MVDWKTILDVVGKTNLRKFATGALSGNDLRALANGTDAGGEVRNLLVKHRVVYARRLARKALRRRGSLV